LRQGEGGDDSRELDAEEEELEEEFEYGENSSSGDE